METRHVMPASGAFVTGRAFVQIAAALVHVVVVVVVAEPVS